MAARICAGVECIDHEFVKLGKVIDAENAKRKEKAH